MSASNPTDASLRSFQRLIAEASHAITLRGLALYAASPQTCQRLAAAPFSSYVPKLAEELKTPAFADLLALARPLFGEPSCHLSVSDLESLRQLFFDTAWQAASAQTWFPQEGGHAKRVARNSVAIARELGFSPSQVQEMYWGGLLHDIGKLFVGELFVALLAQDLPIEVAMPFIRPHPSLGRDFLESVLPLFPTGLLCAALHQESVDGSGYPDGLRYEQLPLESQIASLADAYDATVTRLGWTAGQVKADFQRLYARAGHLQAPVLLAFFRTVEECHHQWYKL